MTRLDVALVARGLFQTRARAQAAIKARGVTVDGHPARSASQTVRDEAVLEVEADHPWVGRGGVKLAHALDLWPIAVEGRIVLDVGASTGGFTEVCLARGAARVFAVDVGFGQLHPRIAGDPRVVDLERTDARALTSDLIPVAPELVVCDASFISVIKLLPAALAMASEEADLVVLVKPQFEAEGPAGVGKGGIVRDPAAHEAAVARVSRWLDTVGWNVNGSTPSPITGGDGNTEFLIWATRRER